MIRIMLVDDEPPFIEELKRIITEYREDCEIIGEYYSGKSALSAISQLHPDIIFTDIKMPVMDGVEFSKAIQENYPQIITIVISAYSSFDFVRETFRADVFDYLLKPIEPETVKSVMDKIFIKIENNKYYKDFEIYSSIIFSEQEHFIPQPLQKSFQNYVVFILNSTLSVSRNSGLNPLNSIREEKDLSAILKDQMDSADMSWVYDLNNEIVILMGFNNFRESKIKKLISLVMKYFENINIPLSLGVSGCISNINDIKPEYSKLKKVLIKRVVIGKSQIIKLEDPYSIIKYNGLTSIEEGKLLKYIHDKNLRELKEVIIQIFSLWEQQSLQSSSVLKNMKDMLRMVERSISMMPDAEILDLDNRLAEIVSTSRSFGELLEAFWSILQSVLPESANEKRTANNQDQFALIIEYMRMNLAKPVTLMSLSEVFGVSQTYLCNIFRNKAGKTFVEYMTQLRMETAKQMMCSGMLLKDIAEIVGFTDQHYFSRVFKTFEGVSPTDYQKAIKPEK
jgi:two-component system, response regulator YesN